jgi:ATP-dependent exoDNAse (exonuclease V) alpha subunit
VLVDEVFMCTEWMYAVLLALARRGVRLILAGDPEQLPPVRSGIPSPAWLVRSRMVHELVRGRCVRLCAARRSRPLTGAPSIFALCESLLAEPCSRAACARFVANFAPMRELPDRNLAYLNATCASVNAELARRRARGRRWLAFDGASTTVLRGACDLRRAPKGLVVYPTGAPLVARSATFFDRGARVVLRSVCETHAVLDGERASVSVGLLDVALGFELAFCTTIHKSQCATIDEIYAVHDVAYVLARVSPSTARALLYVACSRARGAQLIRIAGD